MKDYFEVHNIKVKRLDFERWTKSSGYVIVKNGRWGYKWLHRLIWRIATNLGMIRHEKNYFMDQQINKTIISLKDKKYEKLIYEMASGYLNRGLKPEDIILYVGPDWFRELTQYAGNQFSFEYPVYIGGLDRHPKIYGFKIIVVPEIQGAVALPREDKFR